jgi:hypothetical protein
LENGKQESSINKMEEEEDDEDMMKVLYYYYPSKVAKIEVSESEISLDQIFHSTRNTDSREWVLFRFFFLLGRGGWFCFSLSEDQRRPWSTTKHFCCRVRRSS